MEPPQAIQMISCELEANTLLIKPVGISAFVHRAPLISVAASSNIYSVYGVVISSLTGTNVLVVLY